MVNVASQFRVKVMNVRKELNEVLNFILELGKVRLTNKIIYLWQLSNFLQISEESARSNQTNVYRLYSISDLQNEFYSIDWLDYLQGLLRTSPYLRLDDIVNVSEPVYLKKLEALLRRTNKK